MVVGVGLDDGASLAFGDKRFANKGKVAQVAVVEEKQGYEGNSTIVNQHQTGYRKGRIDCF